VARSQKDAGPTDRPTPNASAVLKNFSAFINKRTRTRETWNQILRREREGGTGCPLLVMYSARSATLYTSI
jgi:hypothetical protein